MIGAIRTLFGIRQKLMAALPKKRSILLRLQMDAARTAICFEARPDLQTAVIRFPRSAFVVRPSGDQRSCFLNKDV
jgi:hypothetical protein